MARCHGSPYAPRTKFSPYSLYYAVFVPPGEAIRRAFRKVQGAICRLDREARDDTLNNHRPFATDGPRCDPLLDLTRAWTQGPLLLSLLAC